MRVLAAMSGGVDSAVAAARARDAGHEVTGVHLGLSRHPAPLGSGGRGCCTRDDARDAQRAADVLGLPFYVWDLSERFAVDVVADFVAEYAAGRTPNPCLRCNERIKFAAVLDRALGLGFDVVCTGHYALRVDGPAGPELHRAVDLAKDQSYVLAGLEPAQVGAVLLPLGESTKAQVRREAAQRGLAVAAKPDSYDVCFVPDGDTAAFLARALGPARGPVVDVDGTVLGHHDGAYAFTVGQRRGLHLDRPAPDGRPRYVLAVSPAQRTVTVGPREGLAVAAVEGTQVRWCGPAPSSPFGCTAQLRAHGDAVPARAEPLGDRLLVHLGEPVEGVAPGQAVVVYDGTRVVGSATIGRTRAVPRPVEPDDTGPVGARP